MKYLPVFIISIIFFVFGCGYSEIRNQNLLRPVFDVQKTYYFDKSIFEFIPTYYVYNAKVSTYYDKKDREEGTLFKISKKADFSYNGFLVSDLKNNMSVILKQNDTTPENDIISYSIAENGKTLLSINQQSRFDFLKYDFIYNNEKYLLEGKINGINGIVNSFVFTLTRDGKAYVSFFKEYYYFKNEHEIIINRKEKQIGDIIYIATCAFIDQVLKENGYEFRS
jgi:hypothetical protein